MKIAMAQTDVEQGDIKKNILKVDNFASRAKKEGADLIVFPEMFVCGFDYKKNMEFLESNSGSRTGIHPFEIPPGMPGSRAVWKP